MTEAQWLTSTDPREMLRFLEGTGKVSERRLRLFACACCLARGTSLADVEEYERVGFVMDERSNRVRCSDLGWARGWTERGVGIPSLAQRAIFLRDIAGNPFRPVACADGEDSVTYPPHPDDCRCLLRPWFTRDVLDIAESIYEERAWERLPILADALQEAGCTNEDILKHCRGWEICTWCVAGGTRPVGLLGGICTTCQGTGWIALGGPHVRGCHVVDLLLGKP